MLFAACHSQAPKPIPPKESALQVGVADSPKKTLRPHDPQSDGSYERFMDSLLSKKDIVFSSKKIEAGDVWLWSKMWGAHPKEPYTFQVGNRYFLKSKMEVVNDDNRLNDIYYEVDTAIEFSLRDKKYAYVSASYRDCNGTGCMEEFYFIADYQLHRLHVFEMNAVPGIPTQYFGDFNHDGQLDFLVPECECMSMSPYCDTTETVALIPYTLNKNGHFVQMKNDYKKDKFMIGQFDSGVFAPCHFRIIGDFWDR